MKSAGLFVFIMFWFCNTLVAQTTVPASRKTEPMPAITADLISSLELNYLAPENLYRFNLPLYGTAAVSFEEDSLQSVFSVEFYDKLAPGDTYIQGGTDYSYMKIGYYRENWGTGRSASVINKLNPRDTRYPANIFYNNYRSPNPFFTLSLGDGDFVSQVAVSLREDNIESVDDALLGLQFFTRKSDAEVGIGMIRYAGYPPPLFFFKAGIVEDRNSAWLEAGWHYNKDRPDRVDLVIGAMQKFERASVAGEFIFQSANPLFFLQENFILTEALSFTIGGFIYLPTFSSALNAYFTVAFADSAALDLGTFLFFGKEGSFFSRYDGDDNYNSVYIRIHFTVSPPEKKKV